MIMEAMADQPDPETESSKSEQDLPAESRQNDGTKKSRLVIMGLIN